MVKGIRHMVKIAPILMFHHNALYCQNLQHMNITPKITAALLAKVPKYSTNKYYLSSIVKIRRWYEQWGCGCTKFRDKNARVCGLSFICDIRPKKLLLVIAYNSTCEEQHLRSYWEIWTARTVLLRKVAMSKYCQTPIQLYRLVVYSVLPLSQEQEERKY